jgi:hypothetical protein
MRRAFFIYETVQGFRGSGFYNCEYRIMNFEYRRNKFYLFDKND